MQSRVLSRLLLPLARRWVAGDDSEDALRMARRANSQGMHAIINLLGEHTHTVEKLEENLKAYLHLLDRIGKEQERPSISIKLTQVGLGCDDDYCVKALSRTLDLAQELRTFVWFDMEGSPFTTKTIDIYTSLLERFPGIGVAIQAYLKRSFEDVKRLVSCGGMIRLCKGAYREPPSIALQSRDEIRENFLRIMTYLFGVRARFAVASHDDVIIDEAVALNSKYPCEFEFQMLMGVRLDLRRRLLEQGYTLSEYIPYGREWLPYALRRLREKKSNVLLLAQSLLQR